MRRFKASRFARCAMQDADAGQRMQGADSGQEPGTKNQEPETRNQNHAHPPHRTAGWE